MGKARDNLANISIERKIILNLFLKKCVEAETRLMLLRTGASGKFL
jgi:hypothetical protein